MNKKFINDVHHLVGVKKVTKVVPATVIVLDNKYYAVSGVECQVSQENYATKLKWFRYSKTIFWVPVDDSADYCFMGYDKERPFAQVYKVDYEVKVLFNLLERILRILAYGHHYDTTKFSKQTMAFAKFRNWVFSHKSEDYKAQVKNAKICICNLNGGDYKEAMRYVNYWECGLAYCSDYKMAV